MRPARLPNLVFVLADQLGYCHCGYAGNRKARTPNVDAFAASGVDFFNAVANTPVCAAYRASMLTGKHTTSTGMVINELRLNPRHECFGHVLTRAGYETGYIGKWHLYANEKGNHDDPKNSFVPPGPYRLGFDGHWAAYNFHHEYYDAYYHTDSPAKVSYPAGAYEPDAQTDMAVEFIREASAADRPFACFLSYGTPHDPWGKDNVPAEYLEMFEGVEFPNPPNYREESGEHVDGWGSWPADWRERLGQWRRVYYAMTANLDWNLGRLVDAIDQAGLAEDTIVVFASDHGEMFGAQGRRAKNTFYEEAIRVPFLVRWPGRIPAGRRPDACLATVDIMPTVLSLLDLTIPDEVEGMDLSQCAMGRNGPEPGFAVLQNTGACAGWADGYEWRALRDKRHTYALYREDGMELLFDNRADPYQMHNLADDPAHAGLRDRCRQQLRRKMTDLEDSFEAGTWYRDHWTDGNRNITACARGDFPPHPA